MRSSLPTAFRVGARTARGPGGPAGAVALHVVLGLAAAVLACLVVAMSLPSPAFTRCGQIIDQCVAETIDDWLGFDTLRDVEWLRPVNIPLYDYFTDVRDFELVAAASEPPRADGRLGESSP